jgi:hypothetical protein
MPENIKPSGLKLKKNYYETQAPAESQAGVDGVASPSTVASIMPFHRKQDTSQKRWQNIRFVIGWMLFLILGGALVYFRFFASVPGLAPEQYRQYGMIAVGVLYVFSIFLALKDNMFAGLMAIVIPFYPIYYLFTGCGSVFFRAVGAALLAAFGYDCLILIQAAALQAYDKITYWMQNVSN